MKLLPCPFCAGPAVNVGFEFITCGAAWNRDCAGHQLKCSEEEWNTRAETAQSDVREALIAVLNDIAEYERVNNLAPNPGRKYCWDSVARAHTALASSPVQPKGDDFVSLVRLQARPPEGGGWVDIYPSQLTWAAKSADVRAVEIDAQSPVRPQGDAQ